METSNTCLWDRNLSLKAVLLHNENILPSIPVGYAAHMKETYENMMNFLHCINYKQYCWQLCGDFKVIAILLELQPVTQSIAVFCVNGTVVQDMNITLKRNGQKEAL